MTGAVHKRKETLARKKYTNKYGEEIIGGGTPGPESLAGTPSAERMGTSPPAQQRAESTNNLATTLRQSPFLNYDGAGGGVGLAQPQVHYEQEYRSAQRESVSASQNPFLDHGFAERGPRLPTFSTGGANGFGGYGGGEVKREERPGGYGWGPPGGH